jgi:hypothetical protein
MIRRSCALIIFAIPLTTASLYAADPIVGTWKLNVAKSKFPSAETAVKDQTEIYREIPGGEIELTYTRTSANGSSEAAKFTWPAQGGAARILQGSYPEGSSFVEIAVGNGEWYVTYMLNGRQLAAMRKQVSKNTIRETIWAADPTGKPIQYNLVLDRQ